MAAHLDRRVSGNGFGGLVGRTRPPPDIRRPELADAKRPFEQHPSDVSPESDENLNLLGAQVLWGERHGFVGVNVEVDSCRKKYA